MSVGVCYKASKIAALPETIRQRVSNACFAQRNMTKKQGLCLDMIGERNLDSSNDSQIWENFSTTPSINGRFVGLMSVISSTRS
jgi:hypothetical protein